MIKLFNPLLKLVCLAIYLIAITTSMIELPIGPHDMWKNIALVLVALHALETVIAFKYIKSYNGSLFASIGLTLLFGLLHWMPLMKNKKPT